MRNCDGRFAVEGTLNSIAAALARYPAAGCDIADFATCDIFCTAEPSGLGAPYFRSDIGLTFSRPVTQLAPREIANLLLEAIVFRVARIVEEFHAASPVGCVYLSGGLSELPCLQQGIAQLIRCGVYRLTRNPMYVGFGLACGGVSIALGSASGLWLVTPVACLAAAALVRVTLNRDAAVLG